MLWTIAKAYHRTFQFMMKLFMPLFSFTVPELLTGAGTIKKLPARIRSQGIKKILVVTDKGIMGTGLLEELFSILKETDIGFFIYDEVEPNPSIRNIEKGLKQYQTNGCEALVAIGGGSSMDCAKVIGARASNPKRAVLKMKGKFHVRKALPPLYAVPTTAGTGSETTVAAVVSNPETHEKFALLDTKLIPPVAVLDPELTVSLPPHITASTGMDALTHAVECYISRGSTKYTDEYAEKAVKMIIENLESVYEDGSNLEKRNELLLASFYAGIAFTRAAVGYVHAIAHNLGGLYGVPHGLANAIVLPHVLEINREHAKERLAHLARISGIGSDSDSSDQLSLKFIEKIKSMNHNMNIPTSIQELKKKDIPLIAQRALSEAHPDYSVPLMLNRSECEELVHCLLPN